MSPHYRRTHEIFAKETDPGMGPSLSWPGHLGSQPQNTAILEVRFQFVGFGET